MLLIADLADDQDEALLASTVDWTTLWPSFTKMALFVAREPSTRAMLSLRASFVGWDTTGAGVGGRRDTVGLTMWRAS